MDSRRSAQARNIGAIVDDDCGAPGRRGDHAIAECEQGS
jgi:hypothetical protein